MKGGREGGRDGRQGKGRGGIDRRKASKRSVWRCDKSMGWGLLSSRNHMTKRLVKGSPTAGCQK